MRRAIELAQRGWGQTAPNPMVGAVVVRDGQVVGEGWHAQFGGPHAEIEALAAAGESAKGATMYVSLEPCTHHGKTPPCVHALLAAGIARVVVASLDPTIGGGGAAALRSAGVDVEVGIDRDRAVELNARFFHGAVSDRPWVTLKLALSLDGAIADASGGPRWLTGPESRMEVHRLRAGMDAIAVGAGTARCDDPLLTVRDAPQPRVPPIRVVFATSPDLAPTSRLVRTAREIPTVVVATHPESENARALRDAGVEIMPAATLGDGLRALRTRGVGSILVEGGAKLAGGLLSAALVDRLIIFRAPVVLGAGSLGAFAHAPPMNLEDASRLPVLAHRALGDDVMSVYALSPLPEAP